MNDRVEQGDCRILMGGGIAEIKDNGLLPVIVTDPPFNIGYKYKSYCDRLPEKEYLDMLVAITAETPSVVILYPEILHKLSVAKRKAPNRCVSWVYNSNTAKQHRDIAFYDIEPDFHKVNQPYKNPNDKRVQKLIAAGRGARLYDWWEINQVKNVSNEKTEHPCQMPVAVMDRIIGILPDGVGIIDPFCGSGTTGVACKKHGIPFIGYEIDQTYCEIANRRIEEATEEAEQ